MQLHKDFAPGLEEGRKESFSGARPCDEFFQLSHAELAQSELLWSWLWLVFQRFGLTEPLLIVLDRLLVPRLLSKCAKGRLRRVLPCCDDSAVRAFEVAITTLVTALRG